MAEINNETAQNAWLRFFPKRQICQTATKPGNRQSCRNLKKPADQSGLGSVKSGKLPVRETGGNTPTFGARIFLAGRCACVVVFPTLKTEV